MNSKYLRKEINGVIRYAHVVIAERALGRRLPKGVEIHHVDENPKNNSNSNLVICQDMAYHKLLHIRTRVVRAGGNPNTDLYCNRCEKAKHADEFGRHCKHLNGKQSRCKRCQCELASASKNRVAA